MPADGPTRVQITDIDSEYDLTGSEGDIKPAPVKYETRAVTRLAWFVGGAIVVLTLVFISEWLWHAPGALTPADLRWADAIPPAANVDATRKVVETHKQMSDIYTDRSIKLFDAVIGKVFLPVFTTLIGYIIGSRAGKEPVS